MPTTQPRGTLVPQSVNGKKQEINVGRVERLASVIGGGLLTAYAARRRDGYSIPVAALATELLYRGVTGHCPVYSWMGIRSAGEAIDYKQGIKVTDEVVIQKPAAELYRFWRNFENLPKIMRHIRSVTMQGVTRSHWVAEGPARTKVEWDAEIINDFENELITWQSLENADVINAGSVSFKRAPGRGKGTIVKVVLRYDPPGGVAGAAIAKLLGDDPEKQIKEDLRKFKEIMEPAAEPDEQWHLAEFKSSGQENGG